LIRGTLDFKQAGELISSLALPISEIAATLKLSDTLGGSLEFEIAGPILFLKAKDT
jgi:hypothetical protein